MIRVVYYEFMYMSQDLTGGEFEKILSSLELTEGIDYINFS